LQLESKNFELLSRFVESNGQFFLAFSSVSSVLNGQGEFSRMHVQDCILSVSNDEKYETCLQSGWLIASRISCNP